MSVRFTFSSLSASVVENCNRPDGTTYREFLEDENVSLKKVDVMVNNKMDVDLDNEIQQGADIRIVAKKHDSGTK